VAVAGAAGCAEAAVTGAGAGDEEAGEAAAAVDSDAAADELRRFDADDAG